MDLDSGSQIYIYILSIVESFLKGRFCGLYRGIQRG
jgi:hypothetical protein